MARGSTLGRANPRGPAKPYQSSRSRWLGRLATGGDASGLGRSPLGNQLVNKGTMPGPGSIQASSSRTAWRGQVLTDLGGEDQAGRSLRGGARTVAATARGWVRLPR